MQAYTTTISFRAAWRFGVPHAAGQRVDVVPSTLYPEAWDVLFQGEPIRRGLYYTKSLRERGGVQRRPTWVRTNGRAYKRR